MIVGHLGERIPSDLVRIESRKCGVNYHCFKYTLTEYMD